MKTALAPEFFVGRDQEFELAIQLLKEAQGDRRILLVNGSGGFGKTRLIQEFCQQKGRIAERLDHPLLCFQPIDLDDVEMRLPNSILNNLACQAEPSFAEYFVEQDKYVRMERQGADPDVIQDYWNRSIEAFRREFNELTHGQLSLVLLDTFEAIQESELPPFLWDLFRRLQNTLLIIAGRYADREYDELVRRWGKNVVRKHTLSPFDAGETDEYFSKTEIGASLDDEMVGKLFLLTNGHPILLALSEYWLRRDMPFNHITSRSLDELRNQEKCERERSRQEFERVLVNKILELTTIDQALLGMAFLERRFNDEILQVALDLEPPKVKEISRELHCFPFVKSRPGGGYTLHDVMRRLVNQHSWPLVDPQGYQRWQMAKRVVERYYQPQRQALEQKIYALQETDADQKTLVNAFLRVEDLNLQLWRLEADQLSYELGLEAVKAYNFFEKLFEASLSSNHLRQCELLLETVQEKRDRLSGRPDLIKNLEIKRCRWQWLSQHPETRHVAEKHLRVILDQPRLDLKNKQETISTIAGRTDDIEDAIRLRKENVAIARRQGDHAGMAWFYIYLGLAYRRSGRWGQAWKYYELARQLGEELRDKSITAEAIHHAAYIARLQGDTETAEHLCELALTLRRSTKSSEREKARSYQIFGEVYSDMRLTHKALWYFTQSAEICRRLGAHQDLALALGHIANIYRQHHDPIKAETYLNEAIALHERGSNLRGLAASYGEYGCEYRKRGYEQFRKDKQTEQALEILQLSEQYLLKGLECARKSSDKYREADILIDLGLLQVYRYEITSDKAQQKMGKEYLKQADLVSKKFKFVLFQGRAEELRGEFNRLDGKNIPAYTRHFAKACLLLAPYPSERFFETVERVRGWILVLIEKPSQSAEESKLILDRLIEIFEASRLPRLNSLVKECRTFRNYLSW